MEDFELMIHENVMTDQEEELLKKVILDREPQITIFGATYFVISTDSMCYPQSGMKHRIRARRGIELNRAS